jgi:cytochrome P450/ferredoxin
MSVLLSEELDGAPLSEPRLLTYCHQVLSVGNDTTRSLLASFAIALAQHPDQRDLLAADRTLMPAAIEEALRWSTPGRGFVRTATRDTEIAGRPIRAGQRIYLLYAAGNFDPAVFPHPRRFDIRRDTDQPHMAFGFGPHVCIAAQLVRLVTALLFGELLDRYPRFELAGRPEPIRHVLRNGWLTAPIVFGTPANKAGHRMKITVDRDRCVGSAYCQRTAPATFDLGDDGIAVVLDADVTGPQAAAAREAEADCPSMAISVEES